MCGDVLASIIWAGGPKAETLNSSHKDTELGPRKPQEHCSATRKDRYEGDMDIRQILTTTLKRPQRKKTQ